MFVGWLNRNEFVGWLSAGWLSNIVHLADLEVKCTMIVVCWHTKISVLTQQSAVTCLGVSVVSRFQVSPRAASSYYITPQIHQSSCLCIDWHR